MNFLLLESKRDEFLNVYHQIVTSKGINISPGAFKSILLEHLTQSGGLRNLSLASNYYLAGAAKYYFAGELTENKDLALYYNYLSNAKRTELSDAGQTFEPNHEDIWKVNVCRKLNALIKVLRDMYIDSVGTVWEQPEDFGNVELKELFKKYGPKIRKELNGGDDGPKEEETLNLDPNVGNGYTFDIMYSFEDCRRYYEATNPGAWCITYGEGNYRRYISMLNIHYVIFRKNGWENVPREPQKDKWVIVRDRKLPKPQDDYGNSLIAVLQSNKSWEPVFITSRYNHGAGDTGSVEADHAYSTEEFMRITGISQEDLQRIFEIWEKSTRDRNLSRKELNKEKKEYLLKLKEIQIRINGGENPLNLLRVNNMLVGNAENIRKSIFVGAIKDSTDFSIFLVDKCKIIFETITQSSDGGYFSLLEAPYVDIISCVTEKYTMLYNYRRHAIIDIDGISKFKAVPNEGGRGGDTSLFYEVKTSNTNIALIDAKTNIPLRLPNNNYWFNEIHIKSELNSYYSSGNRVTAFFVGDNSVGAFEIVFDSSSREKYFYNLSEKRFFVPPEFNDEQDERPDYYYNGCTFEPIIGDTCLGRDFYSIRYIDPAFHESRWERYCTKEIVFKKDGEIVAPLGQKFFSFVEYLGNGYLSFSNEHRNYGDESGQHIIYNAYNGNIYKFKGGYLRYNMSDFSGHQYYNPDNSRIVFFKTFEGSYRYNYDFCYLFDKKVGKFLYNPYECPNDYLFRKYDYGTSEGNNMIFRKNNEFGNTEHAEEVLFFIDAGNGIVYESGDVINVYEHKFSEEIQNKVNIQPIKYFE